MTSTLPPDALCCRCARLNKVLAMPHLESVLCLICSAFWPFVTWRVKGRWSTRWALNAYCAGGRSCRSKITSQVYRVNRKKEGHNDHNQLTNSKQELFRLNGPNPTGFSLFFFRELTIRTIDRGGSQTMWTRMQSISVLTTWEQWMGQPWVYQKLTSLWSIHNAAYGMVT